MKINAVHNISTDCKDIMLIVDKIGEF